MPKYYVKCLEQQCVLDAQNPLDACVLASEAMCVMTAGISWSVSERGFEKHEDDLRISDLEIIKEWKRRHLGK